MSRLTIKRCFHYSALAISLVLFSQASHAIPLIRDPEIEHTLHLYADPIFKVAGLKESSVKIYIVNDSAINAFVAGGANLFIHTGLILQTATPDMLIGVMAHETGHIAGGHLARGAEKLKNAQIGTIVSYVLGAAAAAATGKPEAAAAVITGSQNTVMRNFLAYTRAHEEAADQASLGYLDSLGISADGLVKTFQLLKRGERMHPGSPDPYMKSHPVSAARIEHVRNHVENSKIPSGQYPRSLDMAHKRMVAKLFAFLETPERTMQKYPVSDKSFAARMARAIAYYKMPDIDRSLQEMDGLIAEAKNDPYLHELKGQILFENGLNNEALSSYEKANALLPNHPLILTDLAKVELAQPTPRLSHAISQLEKATRLDNDNSYTWRLLATAQGKAGNLGLSYLALAEEALLKNNPDEALKKADQSINAIKDNKPALLRAEDVKARAREMQRIKKDMESSF